MHNIQICVRVYSLLFIIDVLAPAKSSRKEQLNEETTPHLCALLYHALKLQSYAAICRIEYVLFYFYLVIHF
jgi:hypothetical protein